MLYGEHVFEALEHFEASKGLYPVPQERPAHECGGKRRTISTPTPTTILQGKRPGLPPVELRSITPQGPCPKSRTSVHGTGFTVMAFKWTLRELNFLFLMAIAAII